ncbi:MAG: DNA polymerase III subunit delta [Lachnospiraceae bacterium]|nr:DNA polymerase III subunit delta [Lachnospiraceae bacterium]
MKPKDAQASLEQLKKDLSTRELRQIYLLYGQERFFRNFYFQKLCEAFDAKADDMNVNLFQGKSAQAGEIIDLAETLPFLAERRVILVKESGFFRDGSDQLAEYFKEPCPSTVFLFLESEVNETRALFKRVKEKGLAVEVTAQGEAFLKTNIGAYLKKVDKRISEETAEYLLAKTGSDMATLYTELEKLVCYAYDRDVITRQDIDAICSETVEAQVYRMIDAIAEKNHRRAMALYRDLLTAKEPPVKIIVLLGQQFLWIAQVKDDRERSLSRDAIVAKYASKRQSFQIGKYLQQAARYSGAQIESALSRIAEAEHAVKSGGMDPVIAVETLITGLMTL